LKNSGFSKSPLDYTDFWTVIFQWSAACPKTLVRCNPSRGLQPATDPGDRRGSGDLAPHRDDIVDLGFPASHRGGFSLFNFEILCAKARSGPEG
jgi:hypothetical protein